MVKLIDKVKYLGLEEGQYGMNCRFDRLPQWFDELIQSERISWNDSEETLYYDTTSVTGDSTFLNVKPVFEGQFIGLYFSDGSILIDIAKEEEENNA